MHKFNLLPFGLWAPGTCDGKLFRTENRFVCTSIMCVCMCVPVYGCVRMCVCVHCVCVCVYVRMHLYSLAQPDDLAEVNVVTVDTQASPKVNVPWLHYPDIVLS